MRGLDTSITQIRNQVFVEVAKVALESDDIFHDIEAIPYKITPGHAPRFRDSIYRERAISSERIRFAMGMTLRPDDKPSHITDGLVESAISEIYYEPPLMQVIPSACNFCDVNTVEVSNQCQKCVAHPCTIVCPVKPEKAIKIGKKQAEIDQGKCIKCGKCKDACPYDAIVHRIRPCSAACGVNAITSDDLGRAFIEDEKCVKCGQCMLACPFGAIADKSQLFQMIRAMREGEKVIAAIAPAFVGQFSTDAPMKKVKSALLEFGFAEVHEVALGADIGAVSEAHHYALHVVGEDPDTPYLFTSCCPAWSVLVKQTFPDFKTIEDPHEVPLSLELTPMVATARSIKNRDPKAKVVFIGPCAAKKLEAMRKDVRSDVDFVITFEEMIALFQAKGIDPKLAKTDQSLHSATAAGRRYAIASGVSTSIEACIREYYPEVKEVKVEHVEGLAECKKILMLTKAGKRNGYLIEGMGCPGGCVGGAGTVLPIPKATAEVKKIVDTSTYTLPPKEYLELELD